MAINSHANNCVNQRQEAELAPSGTGPYDMYGGSRFCVYVYMYMYV